MKKIGAMKMLLKVTVVGVALAVAAGCKPQPDTALATPAYSEMAVEASATATALADKDVLTFAIAGCDDVQHHAPWAAGKTRVPLEEFNSQGDIHCGWIDEGSGEMFTLSMEHKRGAGPIPTFEGRAAFPAAAFDARGGNGTLADGEDEQSAWRNIVFSAPDVTMGINHSVPPARRAELMEPDKAYALATKLVR
jgi:hypothetical protein